MTFFESLLALLLIAIVLLQLARRLSLPYPTMLAGAGVIVAMIPKAPSFSIDPSTCLALFIAPAVVDAAFDFPPGATRRFVAPLVTYAVIAVVLTTAVVAWISWRFLAYLSRRASPWAPLSLHRMRPLQPPCYEDFPCLAKSMPSSKARVSSTTLPPCFSLAAR